MFSIEAYINDLISELRKLLGARLLYVGLQGSYLRGEATEKSDIDIMAVIDDITVSDLDAYRNALKAVGNFDRSCGFICGRRELLNWNPLEICHLLHTTKDYYGVLAELVPEYTRDDERNYVKLSLNNLYHELCHGYVHADIEKNIRQFPMTCKSVFFIMQDLYYLESGIFAMTKKELLEHLQGEDKDILEMTLSLKNDIDFDAAFEAMLEWCGKRLSIL